MSSSSDEFDDYFIWLCELVNVDLDRYSELCYRLHDSDFVWCLELDSNRGVDGLRLRDEYCEANRYFNTDWVMLMEKPCSVLEALVALARTMDDMLLDEESPDRVPIWFWEMVSNLGLKRYTNERLLGRIDDDDEKDIQFILLRWMNREFDSDGRGSIFPLKNPTHDQRERSIIHQMNDYVLENYIEP